MCRRMVYCVCVAILLGTAVVQAGYDRVAYWDDAYPTHWIVEGETIEIRDAAEAAGYRIIGADELKTWMDGHIADGKLSVLIMCKDVFPVTVVESRDDQATVRRYLEAGGKIVFHGDIPFYNVGNADGTETNWGDGGATDILGFNTSSAGRDSSNTVSFTDIGLEWGLTGTWASLRPAAPDITENLTILATDDDGDAAAWVKHFMPGDTFRGFVRVWDRTSIATIADLFAVAEYGAVPGLAADDYPADGADDILRDVVLEWTPGEYAGTHNVYFGGSFEDVNGATVATSSGQNANSLDVGRLDFGQTYFWRVDEVNATPDKTVYKGDIWSFTVEPYAIQIPASTIAVTASSVANDFSPPENTINGSGLGADNAHTISSEHMWFTAAVDLDPWIQYEFDAVQKLDIMRVWNSNSSAEMAIGWGIKDVEIAYSVDGDTWDVLEGATQFSRGTASPTYNAYDTIAFGGVPAKYVRFNIASNWGGILMSYSLSEVQFDMIPAQARTPEPADGATGVVPNAVVAWRAGREASQSTIYVSADQVAVADGSAPSLTSNTNSVDLSSLDLGMGTVYYLRVDEVNEAEAVSTWAGPVWSFTTAAALTVEDFESYGNASPDRPFQAWLDGFGYSSDEFFPTAYGGNGTGAGIGHDIWSLSSPNYDGDIMETSNTIAGSGQAMPFYYTNTGGTVSETQHTFAVPQDWTVGGATTLSIAFRGTAGNTGSLYVKINNTKVTFDGNASSIARPVWVLWPIDLATLGVSLGNITEMAIGVDGGSASGMVLIDDITLVVEPFSLPTTMDITSPGDAVVGVPNDDDWPAAESPDLAFDDDVTTKYLHRKGGAQATGFQITPVVGSTVVTSLTLTTANDAGNRDPITFELSGSNTGIDGPYTVIVAGDVVDFAGEAEWPRFTKNDTAIEFANTAAYTHYQIVFPTLRGADEALMQIAEVELIGTIQ